MEKEKAKFKPPYSDPVNAAFIQSLRLLHNNKKVLFQIVEKFPIPVEIFAPDGTVTLINRACLELYNISDAGPVIGKYNLLNDTHYNDHPVFRDIVQKAFRGDAVHGRFTPPIQNFLDSLIIKEKPFESADIDLYFYPVFNNEALTFVVCVFIVKKLYKGRPEIVKVQEYINNHWKEKFDTKQIAKCVNMGVTQLYGLFNKHIGMTPGDYYRKCKVEYIKEALADKNLSVKDAFSVCGADSRGAYFKIFKELTGLSPSAYRESLK